MSEETRTARPCAQPCTSTSDRVRPPTRRDVMPEMQAVSEEHAAKRRESRQIGRTVSLSIGRRRSQSEGRQLKPSGAVQARAHAMFTRRESGFSRGSLVVKLPGERVGRTRYLILDCSKARDFAPAPTPNPSPHPRGHLRPLSQPPAHRRRPSRTSFRPTTPCSRTPRTLRRERSPELRRLEEDPRSLIA